jgi:hypothetical protein
MEYPDRYDKQTQTGDAEYWVTENLIYAFYLNDDNPPSSTTNPSFIIHAPL